MNFVENTVEQGLGALTSGNGARGGAIASDEEVRVYFGSFLDNSALAGQGGAIAAPRVNVGPEPTWPISPATTFGRNRADGPGGAVHATTLEARFIDAWENTEPAFTGLAAE